MALRNYGHREPRLLRLAPWVDLNVLREAFAQKLLKELADWPEKYSTIYSLCCQMERNDGKEYLP